MKRISIGKTPELIGQKIKLSGWVHTRRDHGKIIFIDLRDRSGIIQVVFTPDKKEIYELASALRSEFVVSIEGIVSKRPDKMINDKIPTGTVEFQVDSLSILNPSKTPPFEIDSDQKVGEETRMKYRYLDLRTPRMKDNIVMRYKMIKFFRDYLDKEDFLEIETPILTKGTPEGAREFIVPSRLEPGKFFVLPQSPQQFKQILMVAGMEKYFQIARCFRDEDQRGDRQAEFTQLDMEMSFIEQEDIISLVEKMMVEMVKEIAPNKKIQQIPFPRISYDEAMAKYNCDKPDLRKDKNDPNELAFEWVVDFPMFEQGEDGKLNAVHHPFTSPKDEDMVLLDKEPLKAKAKAYDLVLNGYEVAGGSIRIHQRELQNKVFQLLGLEKDEIQRRFGHMLEAFEYGAPPHGGIAPGIERLVAILAGEPNIREVMAFPKTGDNRDLMMGAPSEIPEKQLKEANIKSIIK